MAIQIKVGLGWKKGRKTELPKVGIINDALALSNVGSVSLLAAYNTVEETRSSGATADIARTVETLMLRRTQMLQ